MHASNISIHRHRLTNARADTHIHAPTSVSRGTHIALHYINMGYDRTRHIFIAEIVINVARWSSRFSSIFPAPNVRSFSWFFCCIFILLFPASFSFLFIFAFTVRFVLHVAFLPRSWFHQPISIPFGFFFLFRSLSWASKCSLCVFAPS